MRKEQLIPTLTYGLISAIAFIIPLVFYLRSAEFVSTWLLYLGNVLFGIVIGVFMFHRIYMRKEGASTGSMVIAGHLVVIAGILISCILAFLAIMLFIPGLFSSGQPDTVLENAPTQNQDGKTNGMVMMIFMNAIVGNMAAGSFIALIFAYTAKFNQTSDKESNLLKEDTNDKNRYPGQAG